MRIKQIGLLLLLSGISQQCWAPREPEIFGWGQHEGGERTHHNPGERDRDQRQKKVSFKLTTDSNDDTLPVVKPKKQPEKSGTEDFVSQKLKGVSDAQAKRLAKGSLVSGGGFKVEFSTSRVTKRAQLSEKESKRAEGRLDEKGIILKNGKFSPNDLVAMSAKSKSLFKSTNVIQFVQDHISELFPQPKEAVELVYQDGTGQEITRSSDSYNKSTDSLTIGDKSWNSIKKDMKSMPSKTVQYGGGGDSSSLDLPLQQGLSQVEKQYSDFLLSKLLEAPVKSLQTMDIKNGDDKKAFTADFNKLADIQINLGKALTEYLKKGNVNADRFIKQNNTLFESMKLMMTKDQYNNALGEFKSRLS